MSETVVVRYETRADAAVENQRLVQRVFLELEQERVFGRTRATISQPRLGANGARADTTATSTSPVRNTRLAPSRSASLPAVGADTAVARYNPDTSHCVSVPAWNSAPIDTSATAIIDEFNGCNSVPSPTDAAYLAGTPATRASSTTFVTPHRLLRGAL